MIVTGAASQVRDHDWLSCHIPEGADAALSDVTDDMAVLGVMGPKSRKLLQGLTNVDLGNDAFPYLTSRDIEIGGVLIRATRITYVGELGWELYIPAADATDVFDTVTAAGKDSDLALAGTHAMDSLRIEKAYRHWGHDIADQDTVLEAGLGFAVAWDKPSGFIGRDALLKQRDEGVKRRLAQFALDDPEPLLYGNEPIYRNGKIAGYVTTAMYGHTVGAAIGLGYVEDPEGGDVDAGFVNAGAYELEVAGVRCPARTTLKPLYDPAGERVKA
jgi:4-methylaminobutanoate oxidase (formaldehyde-forming)